MPVFMLDTNAINSIGYSESFFERVISTVKQGKIALFVSHIQNDEINAMSDSNAEMKSKLQNFTDRYCTRVPTMGFVLGVSYLGESCLSDGKDIDSICKGNSKMIHDALIAATAKVNADYLVTDDDTLRKRIIRELPSLTLLTNEEFHQMVSTYS